MSRGTREFKAVGAQFRRLHIARVTSDYRYSDEVTHRDAEGALADAEWVAARLASIPEKRFKSLPLAGRGHVR